MKRRHLMLIAVVLCGSAARGVYSFGFADRASFYQSDGRDYADLSANLYEGRGYSISFYRWFEPRRPDGASLHLGASDDSLLARLAEQGDRSGGAFLGIGVGRHADFPAGCSRGFDPREKKTPRRIPAAYSPAGWAARGASVCVSPSAAISDGGPVPDYSRRRRGQRDINRRPQRQTLRVANDKLTALGS